MHKLKKQISKVFLFSLLTFFSHTTQHSFAASRTLTIFAEQNMVQALTKIVSLYSQENNIIISINFNSSSELIDDIDMGEPADIFISGHLGLIETLKQKGLVDIYNVSYIAQDRLNLVTSKDNPAIDKRLLDPNIKLRDALKIIDEKKAAVILDQEESTSGLNSYMMLKSLSLQKLKLFQKLPEDKTAIFNIIHNDPENYAILLSSQLTNKKDYLVLATSKADDIFYQALVIAGDNMSISREFLHFLKSEKAKKIFQENNFIVN